MGSVGHSEVDVAARESLLDVVQERLQKADKSKLVTRLIYVARFVRKETSVEGHRAFYSRLLEKHQADGDDGGVTGLLLCYPWCMVHALEAKTSDLMAVLRELVNSGESGHFLAEARVVASTEDIPSRCFGSWNAAFVPSGSNTSQMDPVDSTTIVREATEINAFMRRLGPVLGGMGEAQAKRILQSLDTTFDDIPPPELVLSLVPADDAPTLAEYLDVFDAPLNVDLDTERVWPMPGGPPSVC